MNAGDHASINSPRTSTPPASTAASPASAARSAPTRARSGRRGAVRTPIRLRMPARSRRDTFAPPARWEGMRLRHSLLAAGALGVLAAPAPALAAWSAPVTVDSSSQANPLASGAFGGSVLTGWLQPTALLSRRDADVFTAPRAITAADPYENAWDAGLDAAGNAVVLTVRKHLPTQRIRATFVPVDGPRTGPVTTSDRSHSSAQPTLDVADDGTAVAA